MRLNLVASDYVCSLALAMKCSFSIYVIEYYVHNISITSTS